jgi:tRNA(fMet)-specific endonuclease VapC
VSFLLDTNVIIALIRLDRSVVKRANLELPTAIFTSSLVMHELYYGAAKSARVADNLTHLENVGLQVVEFDASDAKAAAQTRVNLERRGTPIGPYDVLIAGQALARDLTLVTRNIREFARVDGLRVENWEV